MIRQFLFGVFRRRIKVQIFALLCPLQRYSQCSADASNLEAQGRVGEKYTHSGLLVSHKKEILSCATTGVLEILHWDKLLVKGWGLPTLLWVAKVIQLKEKEKNSSHRGLGSGKAEENWVGENSRHARWRGSRAALCHTEFTLNAPMRFPHDCIQGVDFL